VVRTWTTIEKIIGSSPVPPTAKLAQLTLHAIPLLIHITRLRFRCDTGRSDADSSVVFPELLRGVGSCVRALHIGAMHFSQAPRLEFLETFSLDIHPYHTPEVHKINHRMPSGA